MSDAVAEHKARGAHLFFALLWKQIIKMQILG